MHLDIKKAPGPDGIPTWILRDFTGCLAPPVCAIFNSSIREGKLPEIWKSAITCPIPKVNPPKSIEKDLRPISLTCILSKELETYPVDWLWKIVLPHIDQYQFGAMKKVSTVHALVEICHDWFKGTDDVTSKDRNFVHAVLVDYSKAFDRIHPNILLSKIQKYDIPSFLLHWIADFLSDRSQRVKIGDILSSSLSIWGTVPQGTKMGVLLFLLMIDDLRTLVPTYKYVDDTTLYKVTTDVKNTELQEAVDEIARWSKSNCMKLNTTKTKEMLISFCRQPPEVPKIIVDGVSLERVECVTLLGVKLSANLTWNNHVDFIIKKSQSRLYCLNMLKRAKVVPKDIMQIFCARVRPILEYAAPVWHGGLTKELSDSIEDLQRRACKIALPSQSYEDALESLSLTTLTERRISLCSAFFDKIRMPEDKLNKLLPSKTNTRKDTRNGKEFPLPKCNTNRYKNSFIPYVLYNLQ